MDKQEQIEFIDQLIGNVQNEIKDKVIQHAPESWDGIELRQFIADNFSDCVMKRTMNRKRRIAYNNQVCRMPR